jgi:predicted nuclease with TOPRIM domain
MQDPQNYVSEFITAILSASTVWLGRWLFDRHKDRNDAAKSEVELSDQVAKMWREMSQELEAKMKEMRSEMDRVLEEMTTLKSENRNLKTENTSLKRRVENLTIRLKKFETNHGE